VGVHGPSLRTRSAVAFEHIAKAVEAVGQAAGDLNGVNCRESFKIKDWVK
jgi:hypothetical protein